MPRFLYTLLLWLLVPLIPLRLLWRSLRQPEYLHHVGERFGFFDGVADKPVIWLHCVSVGETHAAAPLVDLLRQRYPGHKVLLTHATPTGRKAGEQLFGDSVLRAYLPYDLPFAVNRFLGHFRPRIGLLMETELWFNLIHACKAGKMPLLLVNARMSARSARGYARVSALVEDSLTQLAAIAAQTAADARRLCELGAPQAVVTGNLKFDVLPAKATAATLQRLCGVPRTIFLAASTREGEEALVLDAVQQAGIPGLLTIIVPRHPQRFDEVAVLLQTCGVRYRRRSENSVAGADDAVLLGDSMGEMAAYYAVCDFAFIGGSLLPYGGQNLIEACALGKPVLLGPHTYNFDEAASTAIMQGAAVRVWDAAALAAEIKELAHDAALRERMGAAGLAFAAGNRGAARRTLALVEKFI
ncbi:MAG TPA: lipid IV(A) 3-deoxy-D-manno-octulosonic acid transferase [Novimethylophilus sp.]|jgi:3-deoxy-D-manno-octulosonic-acid transferase|uniref:lipid IV(A) 3-deoxy-D-manno-octulosonic acid transferase n=1 Tax=Novimethylophilus sp. TaxID=2137426 RepID=UPI002F428785